MEVTDQSIIKSNSSFLILKSMAIVCVVPHAVQGQGDADLPCEGQLVSVPRHFAAVDGQVNIYYQELAPWQKPKGQVYSAAYRDIQATLGPAASLWMSRQDALSSIPKAPKRAQHLCTDTLKERCPESLPTLMGKRR